MSDYDVAIIGAGDIGAAAARVGYVRTAGSARLSLLQKGGEDRRLQPGDPF